MILLFRKILLKKGLSLFLLLLLSFNSTANFVYAIIYYVKSCCIWNMCLLVVSTPCHFYMYVTVFNILSGFHNFYNNFISLYYYFLTSFLIKLWMICLCVAKDNHCTLASLPQYMELSLILHYMRDGLIDG